MSEQRPRLEDFGDVMSRADVMAWAQFRSLNSLYRRVQARRFPAPALSQPARWLRADLMRWRDNGQARQANVRQLRSAS